MKPFKLQGIIISAKNFFEKDKILEVFSKENGLIKILIKGANGKKSRYQGRVEPFNCVYFQLRKGRSFIYSRECDLVKAFFRIREDFNKISLAFYFFEIIKKSTAKEQPNQSLFNLLYKTLELLNDSEEVEKVKSFFHANFLKTEGLLAKDITNISDYDFLYRFENYSGKTVAIPTLIQ